MDPIVDNATDAGEPGATPGGGSAPPEETSEELSATAGTHPESAAGKEPPAEAPPIKEPKAVRELREQRRRRREAEEREAYWRGLAEGRLAPRTGAPGRPEASGFERYEDYEEALSAYAVERARQELGTSADPERAPEGTDAVDRAFAGRIAEAAKDDPEFLEVAADRSLPVSGAMALVIKASEGGPRLLRYLAEHRDEAKRIFDIAPTVAFPDGRVVHLGNPLAAALELGRIEARLSGLPKQPHPKTVSSAPEPVRPVGGARGALELDDERVPIEEFVRRRNEAQYRKK